MVELYYGNGWAQFANFSFLCVALFADLILIRFWLVLGFTSLIVMAFTAMENTIMVDTAIWGGVTIIFHVLALRRHILDEAPVKLEEQEEEVWRFFYRRAGMHRMEFKQSMQLAEWCEIGAGESIFGQHGGTQKHEHLYLIVEGCVGFKRNSDEELILRSGHLFDVELCAIFGMKTVAQLHGCRNEARALTNCVVLRWSFDSLSMIAGGLPVCASYWRNLFAYGFADLFFRRYIQGSESSTYLPEDSFGVPEDEGWLDGDRSRDFAACLSEQEAAAFKRPSFRAILSWVRSMIAPLPPPGLRRRTLPTTRVSLEPYTYSRVTQVALKMRKTEAGRNTIVPGRRSLSASGSAMETDQAQRISTMLGQRRSLVAGSVADQYAAGLGLLTDGKRDSVVV